MKTALILGATGLVGKQLLLQLLDSENYNKVVVFVRRSTGIVHPKLQEWIVDFDSISSWREKVMGDVLFSTLGTTLKKAGSKEAQKRVDYTYQYEVARIAAENGVPEYVLVSTPGASENSWIFYTRIRGELDRDIKKLPFKRIIILKPSVLAGEREVKRRGEEIGIRLSNLLKHIPGLKKYQSIEGRIVASAMIRALEKDQKSRIEEYELDELFQFSPAS